MRKNSLLNYFNNNKQNSPKMTKYKMLNYFNSNKLNRKSKMKKIRLKN